MSNKELIERLNAKPNRPTWDVSLGNGQTVKSMGLGHNSEDDTLRKEAADALELADKRIAEEREQHDIMMERGAEKLAEVESKLAVAREALIQLANAADSQGAFTGMSWHQAKAVCTAALAQIAATEQK